jgi:hypothetical protein
MYVELYRECQNRNIAEVLQIYDTPDVLIWHRILDYESTGRPNKILKVCEGCSKIERECLIVGVENDYTQ